MQVLKWLVGERIQRIQSAQDLIEVLQQWEPAWVSAQAVNLIEQYIDEHAREFCEGEHLGGMSENALCQWADAAVSLVSI